MPERCKAYRVGEDGYELCCILLEDHDGPHISYDGGEEMVVFGKSEQLEQVIGIIDRAFGR